MAHDRIDDPTANTPRHPILADPDTGRPMWERGSPDDQAYAWAIEHERQRHERVTTAARELFEVARELGWGSGEPYWDSIRWLAEAAHAAGYDTSTVTRSTVLAPVVVPAPRAPGDDDPASVVYYLQREDGDIKIGYSANWYSRARALACEHGRLVLLATEPGGFTLEQHRHGNFSALHVTGEWFRPGPALLRHIVGLVAAGAAVEVTA